MQLRDIIEAPKVVSDYGAWCRGEVPRALFPLRKKKLKLSKDWEWRIIRFRALDEQFLILIRLNLMIQEYYAHLAHERKEGIAVICSHDLHVSHKNWHCHFVRGDTLKTDIGYLRDKEHTICFPSGRGTPCTVEFDVTMQNAMHVAAKRFRFDLPPQRSLFGGD